MPTYYSLSLFCNLYLWQHDRQEEHRARRIGGSRPCHVLCPCGNTKLQTSPACSMACLPTGLAGCIHFGSAPWFSCHAFLLSFSVSVFSVPRAYLFCLYTTCLLLALLLGCSFFPQAPSWLLGQPLLGVLRWVLYNLAFLLHFFERDWVWTGEKARMAACLCPGIWTFCGVWVSKHMDM